MAAPVRHHCLEHVVRTDLLAADHERYVEALGGELVESVSELVTLGTAGLVPADRFVVWVGRTEDAVGAHGAILGFAVVVVTQVAYEVQSWGVGELVVVD